MALTTLATTIEADSGGRLDQIVRQLTETSHSQSRGMIDQGCALINGEQCTSIAQPVVVGDEVTVRYEPTQRYHQKKKSWDDRTFTIAYEDEHLIVVDKSAGTLTVPTDNNDVNTLVDRVSLYVSHSKRSIRVKTVHRLDREVSGLLVFGKNEIAARALVEQFKEKKPIRIYVAIVAGVMSNDKGTFRSYLATGKNLDRYVTGPSSKSELAITHYRVLKQLADTTLVEVTLETGKRNQIRVHFAHADHPVLGDPRYKPAEAQHTLWVRKRIALHATSLNFEHPHTGETVSLKSPMPAAFERFLAGKRK
jgi:23S rRNA pseudouridine1911/1915/1917 synthase